MAAYDPLKALVDDVPPSAPVSGVVSPGSSSVQTPQRETAQEAAERIRKGREEGTLQRSLSGLVRKFDFQGLDPHFTYQIFRDDGIKIDEMLKHGYAFVERDEVKGFAENLVSVNNDLGNRVRVTLGTDRGGQPEYGFLMKIPKVIAEEDMWAQDARNREIDAAIRRGKVPSAPGTVSREPKEDAEATYVPHSAPIKYDPAQPSMVRSTKETP